MLILQLQPQVMKNKAGTVLWKAYSPDLSGLWCFPLSLPLYLSCPDVMLITVLFFTALFSLLLLLCNAYNASEAMVALRFSVCFPHEFYDGFFFLNVLNSSWAFIWKEIRGECWPYVSIPVWPSPTAWMKKRIWKKKEISAGTRIWLLCSGVGIKVIRGNNESKRQKIKEWSHRI